MTRKRSKEVHFGCQRFLVKGLFGWAGRNMIRKNQLLDNPETRPVGMVGHCVPVRIREVVVMDGPRREAEPDQYSLCTRVNKGHQTNLGIALRNIALVNTNCIDPNHTWSREAK